MELADAHAHILEPWFKKEEITSVLSDANKNGVKIIINVGSLPENYQETILSAQHPHIYANIGLQPTHASINNFNTFKAFYLKNRDMIKAIGEVGLDYYWVKDERQQELQRTIFRQIIEFSNQERKPLVIHSRAAETDAIQLLQKHANVPVLMHCFESKKDVDSALDSGFIVSVPTSIRVRKKYRQIAKKVPLDQMTLETDSPFQSPYNPHEITDEKEKKNQPKNIKFACEKVAQLINESPEVVAKETTRNVKKFFGI